MRFATVIASGIFAALVSAQSATVSLSPAQESELNCLNHCDPADTDCRAHCETVPSPNQGQAVATNGCVAKCSQGDGSAAATKAYSECVQSCITNNFYTTSFGTPEQTAAPNAGGNKGDGSSSGNGKGDGSNSGNGKGDGASSSGATKTAGSQASGSKTSGATSTPTDNAAPYIAGSAMLGLVGMVLAL